MPSKRDPAVSIELGGKKRHLLLDLNAMAAFEEATGKNIFDELQKQKMSALNFRAFIWACLLHEDKKLTLEQVGSWLRPDDIIKLSQQLNDAIKNALPGEGEAKGPLAASRQAG